MLFSLFKGKPIIISVPILDDIEEIFICEIEAMLGTASPRKPKVLMLDKSSMLYILLVAKRSIHFCRLIEFIPNPSSLTIILFIPPFVILIVIFLLSASID